jgi:multidrug efflux pump subunit AcrA (membrane-fusion protein)
MKGLRLLHQVTSAAQDPKTAELAVQQQQIAVEQAQENLDSITTVAPFDGVVSDVATEVGAYVPEDGTVLTLIDDRTLDLPAQIDETEISKVKAGQSASVTLDAMPGQTFGGTVTAIAPTGRAVSNIPIFDVTVTLDNQALTLRPGMTAQADIAVRTVDDAVTLPLTALHAVPSDYDFRIQNQTDSLESLNSVTRTLTLFLGAIAGISLLVGGIGIMNIMLVSVTERTREIGIRKALGAKPRHILAQFLTESVVLSVGGGLLGVALGLAIALLVIPHFGITAIPSVGSSMLAFTFAVSVGVFFGYYPARRASAPDPVASLRYE